MGRTQAACACLQVRYQPTKTGDGFNIDRWECSRCGIEFARSPHIRWLKERLEDFSKRNETDADRIAELEAEVERLRGLLGKIGNDPITFDEEFGTHDDTRWRKCQELARTGWVPAEAGEGEG